MAKSQLSSLNVWYTNADGFLNKKDELELMINNFFLLSEAPQVIVLTEVTPKAKQSEIIESDLRITGNGDPFTNFILHQEKPGSEGKRGITIYD